MATVRTDLWTYRDQSWTSSDLTGYDVEALDGGIGSIDEVSNEVDAAFVVIDTVPLIFGKKVMLPAGTIRRIDHNDEKVYVNRTLEQIKSAPELDEASYRERNYRSGLDSYYGEGGAGWRDS